MACNRTILAGRVVAPTESAVSEDTPVTADRFPGYVEFVAMMAAIMALHAGAIDAMLPALPQIGRAFGVANDNSLQWIVAAFVMGAGFGQLLYGPLSDRYGRRPVLLTGLVLYVLMSAVAITAASLAWLIAFRVVQGFFISAANVLSRSIVRDRYAGATMARVMSTIFMVFLMVPVLAPSAGQVLLLFTTWRGIFAALAMSGTLVTIWIAVRLPETLSQERRQPLSAAHLSQAAWFVVTEPTSVLYTLASTCMFGSLLAYVSTVPQIFQVAFQRPGLMAVTFAFCAGTMGVASFVNSRIVERVGMHRISHIALTAFILISFVHSLAAWAGRDTLIVFSLFQAATMASFGLAVSNFGAIAMQPMGKIAGSAASVQGVVSTVGGAAVGALIGHQWSGNVVFLPMGAFVCGVAALVCVLLAERRQFLRARPAHSDRIPARPS